MGQTMHTSTLRAAGGSIGVTIPHSLTNSIGHAGRRATGDRQSLGQHARLWPRGSCLSLKVGQRGDILVASFDLTLGQ